MKPRVRFAPSPTGEPHLGFARTALYNFLFAKNKGGQFLLRIEDTDIERSENDYTKAMLSSLSWLGLHWDEEVVFQSKRGDNYKKHIKLLLETGRAYRCFASKDELEKIRKEKKYFNYNGLWRNKSVDEIKKQLEEGNPYTIRLKTPKSGNVNFKDAIYGDISVSNQEIDDFIIVRSDGNPVYNFTNVIDDGAMNITHVIRGEDHIPNTSKQILIYLALGWKVPQFAHLPMILGEDRKRLSKRHGAASLLSYKKYGYQSGALINYLAFLGWNPGTQEEIMDIEQLIENFDLFRVQKKSAIFDIKKLNWISSQHISRQDNNTILKNIRILKSSWGIIKDEFYCLKVIELIKSRSNTLLHLMEHSKYFFEDPSIFSDQHIDKIWQHNTTDIMYDVIGLLDGDNELNAEQLEDIFNTYMKNNELGFGKVMRPLRLALSGDTKGPSLFQIIELVGNKTSVKRLKYAIRNFQK